MGVSALQVEPEFGGSSRVEVRKSPCPEVSMFAVSDSPLEKADEEPPSTLRCRKGVPEVQGVD